MFAPRSQPTIPNLNLTNKPVRRVMFVQPRSTGGNFEYVAIFRQGMLVLSGALRDYDGAFQYERTIWMEDRSGPIDPDKDLEGYDILCLTCLINETPRAYELGTLARQFHPTIKIIGGGPQMGPLAEEAIEHAKLDVVVQREGEDVIGILSDLLLTYEEDDLRRELRKIGGLAFLDAGRVVETRPYRAAVAADYVALPDYDAIRDLTPQNPMAAGILETVRGCTENCSFCEVIQQFKGYRMVSREVELARIAQLQDLASRGLIFRSPLDGRYSVFVSDDLHAPPLRATKFYEERLARVRTWKEHTDGMFLISQNRAELGQSPEMMEAYLEAGMGMLYLGVESSNAEALKLIRKRQDPGQVHRDLTELNRQGFIIVAMTIIGLPGDTEQSILEMADWIRGVSRYQTANWLTPLPATINWPNPEKGWTGLTPLDDDGSLLPPGKLRPYILYTGRQFVHYDERWSMAQSREIYAKYTAKLKPIDSLYARIYRSIQRKAERGQLAQGAPTRIGTEVPVSA
ncbi:MAG: radical SAM protein [Dehalococcoidia bacterium]